VKTILVKSVGQLYMELIAHLEKNKEVPLTLQFDTVFMKDSDLLGIHDTIDLFAGKLDMQIEVLYDMPVHFAVVLAALPVEKRRCMPSTIVHFVRQPQYAAGTATDITATGEQVIRVEERIAGIIGASTHLETDAIRVRCDRREYLTSEQAIEQGIFGGYIHG